MASDRLLTHSLENMKSFLSLNSLARRSNLPGQILRSRLAALSIEPDGLVVKESAATGLLFDIENVPQILAAVKEAGSRERSPIESQIQ